MNRITPKTALLGLGTLALMTACGGGGGDSGTPTTPAPPTPPTTIAGTDLPLAVQQTTAALVAFAQTQIAASSDTSDPLRVGDATVALATDDSAEPAAL